jgi:hypothetical protein
VARLADGEDGVEVDVRLDQGRRDQGATEIQHLASLGLSRNDHPIPNPDLPSLGLSWEASAGQKQIEHQ